MNQQKIQRVISRQPYLLAFVLLIVCGLINLHFQPNLLGAAVISRNFRAFLPAMILVVGQTVVIIGGGIDLSVGAIVTLGNAILATAITANSSPNDVLAVILLTCLAGLLAGAFNGWCVAYLRLQPIVTTYATSFLFGGIALLILPRPGGEITDALVQLYRAAPAGIPITILAMIAIMLIWLLVRGTRYAQYLYAAGGKPDAAYLTGVPVDLVKFSTYLWSGLFATIASLALTMNTGTGSPHLGDSMTLPSVVAVVVGGTRLSGGQGGVIGSMIGVIILTVISNIISFGNVPSWSQTLVSALIILAALVGPGLINLVRRLIAR